MAIIKKDYPVLNMSCTSCATNAQNALKSAKGVQEANVNFANSMASITYNSQEISETNLQAIIRKAGYELFIEKDDAESLEEIQAKNYTHLRNNTIGASLLAIPVVIIGMFFMDFPYGNYVMWFLSTPILFWFGRNFFINTWNQAKKGNTSMDTLVALSTGVAYVSSVFNTLFPKFWTDKGLGSHLYFESAAVIIVFISLGKLLEENAKRNTSSAIKKLMSLQPNEVTIIASDGNESKIHLNLLKTGDIILVKPGEKIAVDGTVQKGSSYVEENLLSGEPTPILKKENDKVYAGTINQKGSFLFKAEKIGSETVLSQIIKLVQVAQGSKAPVQKLVDKISSIFVPIVILIAIISFVLWLFLGKEYASAHALLALITVLIIACPCALGLATPTAIMVGIGKGAENGILIKDAESLQVAKKISAIVLDKTGTITQGKPMITDVFWLNNDDSTQNILVGLEAQSEHPLASAITQYFQGDKVEIQHFTSITGKGIEGMVDDIKYIVGNEKLLKDHFISLDTTLIEKASQYHKESKTVIWFGDDRQALAVMAISDKIKSTSKEAIKNLQNLGIKVYMLTGDNQSAAQPVAQSVGIKNFQSSVAPDEKEKYIQELQKKGNVVAMVGDGINDSAALARADVSIAMGKGSDIAIDVANMTIISSDLRKIAVAIKLSKNTVNTIQQNLFWAFIYNIIGIPIAAGILYSVNGFLLNPMLAGAAMAISSVSVVLNSLKLKWQKL